jgi:hypothetical protein
MPVVLCPWGRVQKAYKFPTQKVAVYLLPVCGSRPYFSEQPCFPRAGISQLLQSPFLFFFFKKKKKKRLWPVGLSEVWIPFVFLKPPVRGGERERDKRNTNIEKGTEKPSPNREGISNCPRLLQWVWSSTGQGRKGWDRGLRVRGGKVRAEATSFNVDHLPGQDQGTPRQTLCLGALAGACESCRRMLHPANQGVAHLSWGSDWVTIILWMSQHEGPILPKPWVVFGSETSGGEMWDQKTERDVLK